MKYRGPRSIAATQTEIAWLAGIFDGEGSVSMQRKLVHSIGSWDIRCRIGMCHLPTIQRIIEITGMKCHYTYQPKGNRRPLTTWHACGTRAEIFLMAVVPFLVTKREQALIALAAFELRRNAPRVRNKNHVRSAKAITEHTHRELEGLQGRLRSLNYVRSSSKERTLIQ